MGRAIKKSVQVSLLSLIVIGGVFGISYGLKSHPLSSKKTVELKKPEAKKPGVFPSVKAITPGDGATDVILDIEDPIVVDFNSSTEGFFIKFVLEPHSEVAYENNPEKTRFRLLPKDKILDNQNYRLDIYAKYKDEGENSYRKIATSSFVTLAPAPTSWEKNLTLRIQQARRFTRAKIKEGKYIDINLASQMMTIFEQGKLADAFPISSGKRGMDTPKGDFRIENKANRPWSKAYNLFMPNWMALVPSGKIGIHELPEWPGGYKEGANHLGTPVSHGCVRLGVGAAKKVYDWAEIGTPVVIY
ncbi:MAG: L,D-transpeptidase family protein [Candidatus Moranbacteria bacterium]|nr:L,D-transpeptidase family protein [Candidatus Moranbacteria bacterium]